VAASSRQQLRNGFGPSESGVSVAAEPKPIRTQVNGDHIMAALGIILIVAGAIVAFAIDRAVDGVDLVMLGYILMAGGALALIAAAVRGAIWKSRSNTEFHTERHVSADGQHYVEETSAQ
jgi:hypothetical protein